MGIMTTSKNAFVVLTCLAPAGCSSTFIKNANDIGAPPALLHNRDKPPVELTVESGKVYLMRRSINAS